MLNVYRYSPEFSDFAFKCLKEVASKVVLPATVKMEYKLQKEKAFKSMEKRFAEIGKETEKQIVQSKTKILNSCVNLQRLQYPDVDDLKAVLSEKIDAVKNALEAYFENHASLELIQYSWKRTDYLDILVDTMLVMPEPTQKEIYTWCDEGAFL